MTLSELLESKFRGDIRFRGAAYLEAERVSIVRVTADDVFAEVRDGVEYQTQLTREDEQLRMFCTCAQGSQPEPTCKHLWATILSVDVGNYLTASTRPGYVPPFAVESDELPDFDDEDWDDDLLQGDVFVQTGTKQRQKPHLEVKPRLREWENHLQNLSQSMGAVDPSQAKSSREREIFYEIDVEQSREARQLVIQTSQRQRRANGQWGKLKPLKLRAGQLDQIEHEDDRRILALLSGATPERNNWYAQQSEMQTSIHRYRVPHDLSELILPTMCAIGHIRISGTNEKKENSLVWDEGAAWQFRLEVGFNENEQTWQLKGDFCRDSESLSIDEPKLIVPGGLIITETQICQLEDYGVFEWVELLRKDNVQVPEGEEEEFVDRLLDMPSIPRLELPEKLRLEEVRSEPVPHLVVHSPQGVRWRRERLRGEVLFEYMGTQIRGTERQTAIVQREEGRCLLRDRPQEDRAWLQLQEQGFRRLLDHRTSGSDVEIAARDLGVAVRSLVAEGWQVRADGKSVRQPGQVQFQVKSGIDWFELHADVNFEGRQVAFPELLSALARGDSTVRLDDGSLGILPEEWIQEYGLLAGLGVADEDHVRFSTNQVGLLDALLSTQEIVNVDDRFIELRDKLKSFDGIVESKEPKRFIGELREYQRQGLGWLMFLREFHFGGCLADDMGLGKTVQMLALLQDHVKKGKAGKGKGHPSLIVVPKSLLFNWQQESERFTPDLKLLEYSGPDRANLRKSFSKYDIIMTTYGTLRRDIIELKDIPFEYTVLDEAQAIKNSSSQVAKASRLLQANHRLALSGTPIENHLGDLWSIFEYLNPGMLGRSSVFKSYAENTDDEDSRQMLSRGLGPFILRRTKQQVASELPDKLEQTIHCKMGEEQTRLYNEMRDHYRDSLLGMVENQGIGKTKIHVLEALLRLRQVACHPALLDKSSEEETFAKLDSLLPQLEELLEEGHKALIFSQFTSMLSIVRKHLDKKNVVYEYLDGQTRNRKKHIENFQNNPECGLFLISLKAGGLGLNLTAADYVFLLDPWWNPAVETQAIDRAHRVGQTKQVFAYRLICQDTVEEKIAELQIKKKSLANAILQENSSLMKDLSAKDLETLLS